MNSKASDANKTIARIGIFLLLLVLIFPGWSAFAQSAKKKASPGKPSLDLLVARVDSYWNLLLQRKKAKAAEYVLASERDSFLDRTVPNFTDPRIKSLEPSADGTETKVTVNVKRSMPFGIMDWPVAGRWVYKNANWYLFPYPETMPVSNPEKRAAKIEREETLKSEVHKLLRFEQSVLDFGLVQHGAPVSLSLKYSLEGSEALPVKIETSTNYLTVKGLSNGALPPGQHQELVFAMPTQKLEGTVLESITLTVQMQKVDVPFRIPVQGFVYVPVTIAPKIVRLNPSNETREKELLVRNNSKSTLELQSFSTQSGVVEVDGLPASLPSGQQLSLKVKQVRDAAKPDTPDILTIAIGQPIEDISSLTVSVVLNASEKRDGQIYNPAMDPALQRLIRKSQTTPPPKR